MSVEKRIQFKNTPAGTAEWAFFDPQGNLVIELYDHSQLAEDFFGGDVATQLKIYPRDFNRLLRHLQNANLGLADQFLSLFKKQPARLSESDVQDEILRLFETKFESMGYFQIQKWLKEKKIGFEKIFDRWA